MTPRRQGSIAARERRTQEAQIAALFARPRTCYRAGQRVLAAVVSFFSSPQAPEWRNGRRNGLKHRRAMPVWVRVPPPASVGFAGKSWCRAPIEVVQRWFGGHSLPGDGAFQHRHDVAGQLLAGLDLDLGEKPRRPLCWQEHRGSNPPPLQNCPPLESFCTQVSTLPPSPAKLGSQA
jgi:hypothetical protein